MTTNPWEPWGIVFSRRDGYPILTQTSLWHLLGVHPGVVERVGATEIYVHLDQPYRLVQPVDRDYYVCVAVPGRPKPSPGPAATAA